MSLITISVEVTQAGIHCWPRAPEFVEFLKYPHRHMFHFIVDLDVEGSDRSVEFFTLRDAMKAYMIQAYPSYRNHVDLLDFGTNSCEMLAEGMSHYLQGLGHEVIGVIVSEDNENSGCYMTGGDL